MKFQGRNVSLISLIERLRNLKSVSMREPGRR